VGASILDGMFRNVLHNKSAGFGFATPLSVRWLYLKSYLLTREEYHFVFAALLFLVFSSMAFFIYETIVDRNISRELGCLALNIYHEARGEPKEGQIAVAKVTMNRVASRRYPDTICRVVYQKKWDRIRKRYVSAFSWTELPPAKELDRKTWERALQIAKTVYYDQQPSRLDGALFYHAVHIRPSWAGKKTRIAKIGRHIFYK